MPKFIYYIPLRELVLSQKGVKPVVLKKQLFEGALPYLDIATLQGGQIIEFAHKDLGPVAAEKDILVVWDGSRSGLVFKGQNGIIGSTLMGVTPVELDSDYLFYFLKSKFDLINKNTTGASIPHVNSEIFYGLEIPFMPLDDQKKVVKRLHEKLINSSIVFQKQKTAIQSLLLNPEFTLPVNATDDTARSIAQFRKSVLQHAVTGLLTLSEHLPLNAGENELPLYKANMQVKSWEVPKQWSFIRLKDVVKSLDYGTSSKSTTNGDVPVLRMGNIQENDIDWSDLKYSTDDSDIKKYALKRGDVLFNRTNSAELVGKSATYNSDRKAIFAGYLIRMTTKKMMNPHFLTYCLNSSFAKEYYIHAMVGTANQANISAGRLGEFLVPLPSLKEQNEIVKKVSQLLEIANKVEKMYSESLEYSAKLEQSILQEAFTAEEIVSSQSEHSREYILLQIRRAREAMFALRKQQNKSQVELKRSMKKKATEKPTLDLEEALKEFGAPTSAKEVWKSSKYIGDIDSFYEALKQKVNNTISWKIIEEDTAVPESTLFLKTARHEN
jgi:type I restriction enzyme, S subunit